ncbi:MAG: SusC/RagA family TonB-linked outer membrane protein, partial [Flavitalea sp.]
QSRRFNGSNIIRNAVGQPISSYFGYEIVGFWNSQAEIDAANETARKATNNPSAIYQTDAAVGRYRYNDFGAGIVTPDSRTFLGNANPDFNYGLNIALAYKAFDFSVFFYGVQGNEIWNQVKWWTDFYPSFAGGKSRTALYNSWTPTRTNAKVPIVENAGTFSSNGVPNSYYVEDGSYLRAKNMQIGYTVNQELLKKIGISRLRAYVQAANLFTITKYSGIDPEIGGGPNQFGIDEGAYPTQRQIIFGLNVSF